MPQIKSTIIVIPARYKSTRLPGKPLIEFANKPMIIIVAERCAEALGKSHVYVATDDIKIKQTCEKYGVNVIMTSEKHLTGTDRIAEASQKLNADYIINVQGDEPLINPEDIKAVIEEKHKYPNDIINAYTTIKSTDDVASKTIPKVVVNENNKLIYMSRSVVPGLKDDNLNPEYKKQVCIYGFTNDQLKAFSSYGRKSTIEAFEDIEILRFFEIGYDVRMVEVHSRYIAVDTENDVSRVREILENNQIN